MKLEQLKAMLREWEKSKSLTIANDICQFLADNVEEKLNEEWENYKPKEPLIKDENDIHLTEEEE